MQEIFGGSTIKVAGLLAAWLLLSMPCAATQASDTQKTALQPKAVQAELDKAWLMNDPAPVLALFADDATVIQNGSGFLHGKVAIRAAWWPDNPPVFTSYKGTVEKYVESGNVAYLAGHFDLAYTILQKGQKQAQSAAGNYLTIMQKGKSGRWLITTQMWAAAK